jgi:hypothetical protein
MSAAPRVRVTLDLEPVHKNRCAGLGPACDAAKYRLVRHSCCCRMCSHKKNLLSIEKRPLQVCNVEAGSGMKSFTLSMNAGCCPADRRRRAVDICYERGKRNHHCLLSKLRHLCTADTHSANSLDSDHSPSLQRHGGVPQPSSTSSPSPPSNAAGSTYLAPWRALYAS